MSCIRPDKGSSTQLENLTIKSQHKLADVSSTTLTSHQGHQCSDSSKMIFTDLYKSPRSPLSRLRHAHHPVLAPGATDYDADLLSKDKSRQKEAVKRHLQAKVRNDWYFTWPQPPDTKQKHAKNETATEEVQEGFLEVASQDLQPSQEGLDGEETALDSGEEPDSETESVYSTISDDPLHWRPRLEWASELSEDELPYNSPSPFKYDTPDSIGQAVIASKIARKAQRRRELRTEMAWNEGLACFEARRNAWTGAKVARVRAKHASPISPSSPRRGFFWRTQTQSSSNAGQTPTSPTLASPLSPATSYTPPETTSLPAALVDSDNLATNDNLSPKVSRSSSQKQPEILAVETLLPIPPPLLPPANPMRASIQPQLYNSIYEKVVLHSLQPSCPINLSDMIRACVSGWKRDGEWPPRPSVPEPASIVAVRRKKSSMSAIVSSGAPPASAPGRKMSFSFLSGHAEKDKLRRESAAGEDGSAGSGTGKALRRSLQKVLGIGGHSPAMTTMGDGHSGSNQQH